MKKIKYKLLISILSLSFFLMGVISTFFIFSLSEASKKNHQILEKNLLNNYDEEIKYQVQQVLSFLNIFYKTNQAAGMTEDEIKTKAAHFIRHLRYGKNNSGYFWVDTIDGTNVVLFGNKKVEGTNRFNLQDKKGTYLIQELIKVAKQPDGGFVDYYFPKLGSDVPLRKRGYSKLFKPFGWAVGTGNYLDDIDRILKNHNKKFSQNLKDTITTLIVVALALFLLSVILTLFLSKSLSRPISTTRDYITEITASNDLNQSIPLLSKDEIGQTAQCFNIFMLNLKKIIAELKGDNTVLNQSVSQIVEEVQTFSANFEETSAAIEFFFSQINKEKEIIEASSQETLDMIQGITQMAESGNTIKNQLNSSSEQISMIAESINKMFEISKKGDIKSDVLLNASEAGHQSVKELWKAIESVSSQADRIVDMVQLIMDISEQTNLLAMNAAIEAAHAGEYGKGFAVVAEEIRKLADKSGSGAKEIQEVVSGIVDSIDNTGLMVEKTNKTFEELQKGIIENKENSQIIYQSVQEQQHSNHKMGNILQELSIIGNKIALQSKDENEKGKSVSVKLKELESFNMSINQSMQEQKEVLQNNLSMVMSLKNIAQKLEEITSRTEKNFKKFKN